MTEDKRQNLGDRRQGDRRKTHRRGGHHHHHSSHRSQRKKTIKLFLLITGICFVIGLIISILIGKLPQTIDRIVSKQIEGEIARTVGKDVDIDQLKRDLRRRRR